MSDDRMDEHRQSMADELAGEFCRQAGDARRRAAALLDMSTRVQHGRTAQLLAAHAVGLQHIARALVDMANEWQAAPAEVASARNISVCRDSTGAPTLKKPEFPIDDGKRNPSPGRS